MKKAIYNFFKVTLAVLFSLTIVSCSDLFNSRTGSITISLPSARASQNLPEGGLEELFYEFEVCNSSGHIIYKPEELTPKDSITVSDIEPGKYSVVVKAYSDNVLKYANYSSEKYVNVKAGEPTPVTITLHKIPDFNVTLSEGTDYALLGNIDSSNFIIDGKAYSDWKDSYTLSYDSKAFGLVPVTVTCRNFDFLTKEVDITVKYSLEEIVPVTLNGQGGNKETGSSYSFSVEPVKPDNSYFWYKTFKVAGELIKIEPVKSSLYNAEEAVNALKYQWYDNNEIIEGATDKTLTVTNAQAGEHNYHCVVTMQAIDPEYCIEGETYDYTTEIIKVTVEGTPASSDNRYSHWEELETAVEAYTGTDPKTFIIYGSCSATSTISVKGNVIIYPDADVIIDRQNGATQFTEGALFQVEQGASLTLGGNKTHTLKLDGNSGNILQAEGASVFSAATLNSSAPLIYSYGNLTISDNCYLQNNYNETAADETMGGAIHSQVKETGDSVSLTLQNCTITNCYSGKNGGAVWAKGLYYAASKKYTRITFVMDNAEIVDNCCNTNGGGLFLANIDGEIKNGSYVRSNNAGASVTNNNGLGGGIYLSGTNSTESTKLSISSDSYIVENTANQYGGGIYQNSLTTLTVINPEESLKDNTLGSAVSKDGSQLYINISTIYNEVTYTEIQKIN